MEREIQGEAQLNKKQRALISGIREGEDRIRCMVIAVLGVIE
jgi:hypothetical protein